MRCEYYSEYLRGKFQCERERIPDKQYCIFHDNEYWKTNSYNHQQVFNNYIENDLALGGNVRHFVGYHIPNLTFRTRILNNPLYFDHATFHQPVSFGGAEFRDETSFVGATFEKEVNFHNSIFLQKPHFREAKLKDKSYFYDAQFRNGVNFYHTIFEKEVTFQNTRFDVEAFFPLSEFRENINCNGTLFAGDTNFSNCVINKANFSHADFAGEVDFFYSIFPEFTKDEKTTNYEIPIKFDYATFRRRARFAGKPDSRLSLESVSLKGVDLSNAEFHNVKWLVADFPTRRNMIVDEKILESKKNYEEVSKIYNQLRKNYESKLLFNEASNFFIGEMESIRKSLWRGTVREKFLSIPYALYKVLSLYGESAALPLLFWSPMIVLSLTEIRNIFQICSTTNCNELDKLIDSFFAYFLLPRSNTNPLDLSERIISVPILSMSYIALRRKFERRK